MGTSFHCIPVRIVALAIQINWQFAGGASIMQVEHTADCFGGAWLKSPLLTEVWHLHDIWWETAFQFAEVLALNGETYVISINELLQPLDVELHYMPGLTNGLKAQLSVIGGVLTGFVTGIHMDSVRRWNFWFPSAGVFTECWCAAFLQ